jgi:dipeptidyl aminopeptidase/acylaminoacyl peptidase
MADAREGYLIETLVQFRNRKGKWLRGMVHRPEGGAGGRRAPGVIFFHGFTANRMESHWIFVKTARALANAGIASLRFDFYGSGESEGDFREVTLEGEISDGRVAVEFLRRQKGIDAHRIGAVGLSLGGSVAASLADRARVRALVLWAALAYPKHLRNLSRIFARRAPGGSGALEYSAQEISSQFLDNVEKIVPTRSIRRFKGPILIVQPERDDTVPLSHAEDFYQAAGSRIKRKVIIPGADHTFSSVAWERDVIGLTVEWFRAHLMLKHRVARSLRRRIEGTRRAAFSGLAVSSHRFLKWPAKQMVELPEAGIAGSRHWVR